MDLSRALIGGAFVPTTGPETRIISPVDGAELYRLRLAGQAEAEAALVSAKAAEPAAAALPQAARAAALETLADRLATRAEAIGTALVMENGCPSRDVVPMQALSAIAVLRSMAPIAAEHPMEEVRKGLRGGDVLVRKIPVGTALGVTPWNAPVFLACVKIASAVAAGCPLILKPAPETIGATMHLAEALAELDLPQGMISVLHGDRDLGRALVADPRVAKISFTGSVAGGQQVAAAAAERMARVTLELGGKSAAIICEDVDLDAVLPELMAAMVQNNGQICGAQTRLLISRPIYEQTLSRLAEAFANLKVGDPRDPETAVGPVISAAQAARIKTAILAARQAGGRVVAGDEAPKDTPPGYYVAPTLVADLPQDSELVQSELFGPVIVALPFDDDDHALHLANDSRFGLAASVWSSNQDRALWLASGISSGTVALSSKRILDFGSPFGGLRMSGMGRELGPEGIDSYLEKQSILAPHGLPSSSLPTRLRKRHSATDHEESSNGPPQIAVHDAERTGTRSTVEISGDS